MRAHRSEIIGSYRARHRRQREGTRETPLEIRIQFADVVNLDFSLRVAEVSLGREMALGHILWHAR